MPKLKPSEITAKADIISRNILSRGAYFGCRTCREFEEKLGIPRTTFNKRIKNPREFTLEQLIKVCIAFKCSLQWLVTDHSGELTEGEIK